MNLKKQAFTDVLINSISYGLPIFLLQFVVLPYLAADMDSQVYGKLLAITGVVGIISEMSCGTLANVRVLENDTYLKKNSIGIFQTLFYTSIVVFTTIVYIVAKKTYGVSTLEGIYICIYFFFLSIRAYYISGYRIDKKFNKVFLNNILVCIGYYLGLLLYKNVKEWQILYIVPMLLACIHLWTTTSIVHEHIIINNDLPVLTKQYLALMISYIIGSGMAYFDRIALYPMMGGEAVSIYHTATLMGKLFSMLCAPIGMVILSYIAKEHSLRRGWIIRFVSAACIAGALFYVVALLLSPMLVERLYPQYYSEARQYIGIVTISLTAFNIATIVRVLSMKVLDHKAILLIEAFYAILYIALSLILVSSAGLMGFCYASLVASGFRLLVFSLLSILYMNVPTAMQKKQ